MRSEITVDDHIEEWADLDDEQFGAGVEQLTERLCREQPLAHLIRFIMGGGPQPLLSDPHRRGKLEPLVRQDLKHEAESGLARLAALLPPPTGSMRVHLVPARGIQGSGVCFAPDELIVAVPVEGDSHGWLLPTLAHEYSHTQRGFKEHKPITVRDTLVFEGLAMILPEVLAPWPNHWKEPSSEEEAAFWKQTDFDTEADEAAHTRYIQNERAYVMATRIIRSYIDTHGISIVDAHGVSNDELYWSSGYPGIR